MKDQISVIIPVRDKEIWRLKEVIKRLNDESIKEIIIVDYASKKEIKLSTNKTRVIRYDKGGPWNKAHAINIGVKKAKGTFIMTLDADILLLPDFFNKLRSIKPIEKSFIYSSNVKRIEREDIGEVDEMISKCKPWHENSSYLVEMSHTATGGVQVFPKSWFMDIRGINENLVYYGGMDNITLCDAKKHELNIVSMNSLILHIEHTNKKEDNFSDEKEKAFAQYIRSDRRRLLNYLLEMEEESNPKFWGSLSKPNCPFLKFYKQAFEVIYSKKMQEKPIEIPYPKNTKIMLAPICNGSTYPIYFAEALQALYDYTRQVFPNIDIVRSARCDVNHMRNTAIDIAIQKEYDILIQLDIDHVYPQDFIIKLMSHGKKFINGMTVNRTYPIKYTQFKKILPITNKKSNIVIPDGKLQKIEATGVVGMLMDVATLKSIPRPWFKMTYAGQDDETIDRGGDLNFCRLLKEHKVPIYCDTSIEFSHHNEVELTGEGLIIPPNSDVTRWQNKNNKKIITEYPELPSDL